MMYGDPESLLSHIQQEFVSRLEWDWNKIMQRHAKTHSATTRRKPSQVLQHRWGKVASCNKEGNEVSIMLANNWPGWPLLACLPYDLILVTPCHSLTPPLRCLYAQVVP